MECAVNYFVLSRAAIIGVLGRFSSLLRMFNAVQHLIF